MVADGATAVMVGNATRLKIEVGWTDGQKQPRWEGGSEDEKMESSNVWPAQGKRARIESGKHGRAIKHVETKNREGTWAFTPRRSTNRTHIEGIEEWFQDKFKDGSYSVELHCHEDAKGWRSGNTQPDACVRRQGCSRKKWVRPSKVSSKKCSRAEVWQSQSDSVGSDSRSTQVGTRSR